MSQQREFFIDVPPPPPDKWSWSPLSGPKIKREEIDDDVVLLGETPPSKKPRRDNDHNDDRPNDVHIKMEETAGELKVKLERKVKIEPTVPVLDEVDIRRRLDGLPRHPFHTTLTEAERMHTVPRQLLTSHYKGAHNVFTGFTINVASLRGWTSFMCPNRSMNPYQPCIPGTNGLFLNSGIGRGDEEEREDGEEPNPSTANEVEEKFNPAQDAANSNANANANADNNEEKKKKKKDVRNGKNEVFAVLAHIAPGHWRYVGHYAKIPVEPLSIREWNRQTATVKNAWVTDTMTRKDALDLRLLVWHRKRLREHLKRDPTKEEVRRVVEPLSRRKKLPGLVPKDIEKAFGAGELRISIFALCFLEYLEDFQRELIDISANPRPLPRRPRPPRPQRDETATKTKAKTKTKTKPKPSRRAASDDSYVDD